MSDFITIQQRNKSRAARALYDSIIYGKMALLHFDNLERSAILDDDRLKMTQAIEFLEQIFMGLKNG